MVASYCNESPVKVADVFVLRTCFMIAIERRESAVRVSVSPPFFFLFFLILGTKQTICSAQSQQTPVEKAGIWLRIVHVHSDACTRASTCALGVMKAKDSHNSRSLNFSPKCNGILTGKRFTSTSDSPQRPFPGEPAESSLSSPCFPLYLALSLFL